MCVISAHYAIIRSYSSLPDNNLLKLGGSLGNVPQKLKKLGKKKLLVEYVPSIDITKIPHCYF
jgi:hypothetical protein